MSHLHSDTFIKPNLEYHLQTCDVFMILSNAEFVLNSLFMTNLFIRLTKLILSYDSIYLQSLFIKKSIYSLSTKHDPAHVLSDISA